MQKQFSETVVVQFPTQVEVVQQSVSHLSLHEEGNEKSLGIWNQHHKGAANHLLAHSLESQTKKK